MSADFEAYVRAHFPAWTPETELTINAGWLKSLWLAGAEAQRSSRGAPAPTPERRRDAAAECKDEALGLLERIAGELAAPPTPGATFKPAPALGYVSRVMWLLGLSDAERSFVDAAAEAVEGGDPALAYEGLSVFADWLEDMQRGRDATRVRRLADAEELRLKGWVNTNSTAACFLADQLANLPEKGRKGNVFQRAAWAIDRMKKEAADLRRDLAEAQRAARMAASEPAAKRGA